MKCVQVYTEKKNVGALRGLAASVFSSYTMTYGIGVFRGQEEKCLVFTIVGAEPLAVKDFADMVKVLNAQHSVLVVESEVNAVLV